MTVQSVANAFAQGRAAKCHNAATDGQTYTLHGSQIAFKTPEGLVQLDWCGYYTGTTARHLNAILKEYGQPFRVSYAQARQGGQTTFSIPE